jgi:hypothetical protein
MGSRLVLATGRGKLAIASGNEMAVDATNEARRLFE